MGKDYVPIMCYYNGVLSLEANKKPRYDGGESKLFKLGKSASFEEFKEIVYQKTRINPTEYELKLFFRCPLTAQEFGCVGISDDDDLRLLLGFYPDVPSVMIYVVKEAIETHDQSTNLMDAQNESTHILPSNWQMPTYGQGPQFSNLLVEDLHVTSHDIANTNLPSSSRGPGYLEALQVDEDNELEDEDVDIVQEHSMTAVMQDYEDEQWVHEAYINNSDVELEKEPPDEDFNENEVHRYVDEQMDIDDTQWATGVDGFSVGQIFETKEELVRSLTDWSVRRSVAFKPIRSNPREYTVVCATRSDSDYEDCPWRLHASISGKFFGSKHFTVKSYNASHTCRSTSRVVEGKQLTVKFIYKCILPCIKRRLDLTPAMIQEHMRLTYHKEISYFKAWEARRKALSNIFGDWVQSYLDLPSYLLAIRESNPGTVFTLRVDPIHDSLATFRAVFWAFGPSIEGFHHCRPLLSIDGTHLYGKYPGVLLVATGVDADGGLFPLAFAVVNTEDKENWEWFFACIREYIPSVSSREITWISDRMKGIPNALQQGWRIPHHHRYCLRHIKANFKRSFKDEPLQNMLYNAGRTPDSLRYTELRNRIKELSPDADKWIEKSLGPENEERWALCKDGGRRYCIMTTNCSESFNGVLKGARALLIQSLIARTFYRLNKYFVTRRELSAKWRTRFAPKVENLLRARNDESRSYELRRYSEINWEVIDNRGFSYSVDMTDTECSCNCNVPMLQKLPCTHVIAATSRVSGGANIDYGILCSDWYIAERYRQTYEPKFKLIPDRRYWNKDLKLTLAPPDEKRKKGRPRNTRLRNEMDYSEREGDKKKTKCSKCKKYGHNKKRCTAA